MRSTALIPSQVIHVNASATELAALLGRVPAAKGSNAFTYRGRTLIAMALDPVAARFRGGT